VDHLHPGKQVKFEVVPRRVSVKKERNYHRERARHDDDGRERKEFRPRRRGLFLCGFLL
jgi:hypothetical protein